MSTVDPTHSNASSSMTRRRAVVIDDDPAVATILADVLMHCGVEVVALARDDEAGAALLGGELAFELAFIDLKLGGALKGVELARQAVERGIQVVVVTGSDRLPEDLAGPALLMKPFSMESVRLVLDTLNVRAA